MAKPKSKKAKKVLSKTRAVRQAARAVEENNRRDLANSFFEFATLHLSGCLGDLERAYKSNSDGTSKRMREIKRRTRILKEAVADLDQFQEYRNYPYCD